MTLPPDTAIRVSNLSKLFKVYSRPADMMWEIVTGHSRYRPFWALQNISFEVKRGQVVGIIGRNGAGKSTLLKIITGTLDRTSGELDVNGRISSILELGTGFNMEYSGRENIYLGGLMVGLSHEEIRGKEDWIIEFSELEDFIDQPFKTYSTGMQARLTFATAVCIDPDILIVDEALSVGDARFQRKSFSKIEEFRKSGKTILLVSHDTNQVASFCDFALILENGRVYDQGDPSRLRGVYYDLLFGKGDGQFNSETSSEEAQDFMAGISPVPVLVAEGTETIERVEPEFVLDINSINKEIGYCWQIDFTDLQIEGDSSEEPHRSPFVLCEDGRPLTHGHSSHDVIRNIGKGYFSHWGKRLYFSTSDNSDPRTNQRKYSLMPEDALEDVSRDGETAERYAIRQIALKKLGLKRPFVDQENSHQTRYGNGKAEFLDFGILDEHGKRVKWLVSGRKYTFFSRAVFYEEAKVVSAGFAINNINGMELYGVNSIGQNKFFRNVAKGDIVEAQAHVTMWITNGVYFLSIAIADPEAESNLQFDQRFDAIQFEVEYRKEIDTASIVNLDEDFHLLRI